MHGMDGLCKCVYFRCIVLHVCLHQQNYNQNTNGSDDGREDFCQWVFKPNHQIYGYFELRKMYVTCVLIFDHFQQPNSTFCSIQRTTHIAPNHPIQSEYNVFVCVFIAAKRLLIIAQIIIVYRFLYGALCSMLSNALFIFVLRVYSVHCTRCMDE